MSSRDHKNMKIPTIMKKEHVECTDRRKYGNKDPAASRLHQNSQPRFLSSTVSPLLVLLGSQKAQGACGVALLWCVFLAENEGPQPAL